MTDLRSNMFQMAKDVLHNAYVPYSHYKVGCCIRTTNNQFFVGCNVENAVYGLTCCAEANAIVNMIIHGEKQIAEMIIIAESETCCVPCGGCRQRISEFASGDILIHMGTHQSLTETKTLSELLPLAFGAAHFKQ
jgi:cytidine deaminase